MLPSRYANPGHRVHESTCEHVEHTGRSPARIERTSFSCGECFQMSIKRCLQTLPLGGGKWTHGDTSPYGET